MKDDIKKIYEQTFINLLKDLGEDPHREGLLKTPQRYIKNLIYLTQGYHKNIKDVLNGAIFKAESKDMIIIRNIEFYSLCEHHILPFYGKCHVAYIPNEYILGLSKIPRIVDIFARRLQVQEKLTNQISTTIYEAIKPLGVGVVIDAYHLCMMMRGVEKQHSFSTTSSMLGAFRKLETRNEFLSLIHTNRP